MKAEIKLDVASDDERHIAVVKSVDRVADAASGTFGVLLSLPNSGRTQMTFTLTSRR